MKTQIVLVLLAACIFQVAFAGTALCPTAACTDTTNKWCDRIGGATGGTCIAEAANCATGYGSTSTVATATGAECSTCIAATHALNAKSAAATKCVALTIGADGGCLTGYTDKSDGTAANTVTLVGDCKYCAPGYVENTTSGKCEAASGSMIAYGIMLLAVIFAALF